MDELEKRELRKIIATIKDYRQRVDAEMIKLDNILGDLGITHKELGYTAQRKIAQVTHLMVSELGLEQCSLKMLIQACNFMYRSEGSSIKTLKATTRQIRAELKKLGFSMGERCRVDVTNEAEVPICFEGYEVPVCIYGGKVTGQTRTYMINLISESNT